MSAHNRKRITDVLRVFHVDHIPVLSLRDFSGQIVKSINQPPQIPGEIFTAADKLQMIAFLRRIHASGSQKDPPQIRLPAASGLHNSVVDSVTDIVIPFTDQQDSGLAEDRFAAHLRINRQNIGVSLFQRRSFSDQQFRFNAEIFLKHFFVVPGYRRTVGGDDDLKFSAAHQPDTAGHAEKPRDFRQLAALALRFYTRQLILCLR